jgi:arylsulfatase A-like enzyme
MNNDWSRREFIRKTSLGVGGGALTLGALNKSFAGNSAKRPNILWIVSEDNDPFLGCYGDKNAITPNLDRLAGESIVYDNAFSNAPVCAPARSTIITGMYATTIGTMNMRSKYDIPADFKFFPQYMREAGYYCTNHAKEDYNTT